MKNADQPAVSCDYRRLLSGQPRSVSGRPLRVLFLEFGIFQDDLVGRIYIAEEFKYEIDGDSQPARKNENHFLGFFPNQGLSAVSDKGQTYRRTMLLSRWCSNTGLNISFIPTGKSASRRNT